MQFKSASFIIFCNSMLKSTGIFLTAAHPFEQLGVNIIGFVNGFKNVSTHFSESSSVYRTNGLLSRSSALSGKKFLNFLVA
jgi:hypothetical protein